MGGSVARTLAVLAARIPKSCPFARNKKNSPPKLRNFVRFAMALKQNTVVAAVFLLVVLLHEGLALTCYQCNSHNDTRCSMEKVPDDLASPCPEKNLEDKPYILCRKIKQMIDFEVNGLPPDNRVIRSCGWDDSTYKNRCYHRSGFGGRQEVCACEKDSCNGAGSLAASALLLAATLFAMRIAL